jgi:peptide deformylase
MIMEILTNQNPLLRKISKPVKTVTKDIKLLIENMADTLYAAPGIGLAAPQVGQLLRIIVGDIGEGLIVVINPKVSKKKGKQIFVEGCLSIPGIEAPVERSASVTVKGINKSGRPVTIEATGILATMLQHEVDHLDGTLFTDRVKDPNEIIYKPKTPKDEAI